MDMTNEPWVEVQRSGQGYTAVIQTHILLGSTPGSGDRGLGLHIPPTSLPLDENKVPRPSTLHTILGAVESRFGERVEWSPG